MIDYVYENNIDNRVLERVYKDLDDGNIVAFPTDSSFALACSVKSKAGLGKLLAYKGIKKIKSISIICSSIDQISELGELNNNHFKFIKKNTPGPHVFVLNAKGRINKIIGVKRSEIGVRIPSNPIPLSIIKGYGEPLFSVTASRDMSIDIDYPRESLYSFSWEIEDIPGVSRVVDTGEELPKGISTVVDLTGDEPELIREGDNPLRL